jgi:hypothetical protein
MVSSGQFNIWSVTNPLHFKKKKGRAECILAIYVFISTS